MMDERGINPFTRMYNTVVQEREEKPERFARIDKYIKRQEPNLHVKFKSSFGFATSGGTGITSRNILYSTTFIDGVKNAYDVMNDSRLIDQIAGLTIRNGRIDHAVGEHDDIIVSWLLSRFFLTRGANLDYYGIPIETVLSEVRAKGKVKTMTVEEKRVDTEQIMIRKEIMKLMGKLRNAQNSFIERKYETELYALENKLILKDTETFNLNVVLREIREKKVLDAKKRKKVVSTAGKFTSARV
jgi:hypothetical protein